MNLTFIYDKTKYWLTNTDNRLIILRNLSKNSNTTRTKQAKNENDNNFVRNW